MYRVWLKVGKSLQVFNTYSPGHALAKFYQWASSYAVQIGAHKVWLECVK